MYQLPVIEDHDLFLTANEAETYYSELEDEPEEALVAALGPPPITAAEEKYEEEMSTVVKIAMGTVAASVLGKLSAKARAMGAEALSLDDFNVMTPDDWAKAFGVEAVDIIGDIVVDAATGVPLTAGINVTDDVLDRMISDNVGRLRNLGGMVQQTIVDTLQWAVRDKIPFEDVVRELTTGGPLSDVSARRIARTELTAATNGGMLVGWKDTGVLFKRWSSLHDDRVRHDHRVADGQVQPVELPFQVGSGEGQYPGDPRLPIGERANCRCSMHRVDADGRVLASTLTDATKKELYQLAAELQIPGRSYMNKDQLFSSIDKWRSGFGDQRIDLMTKAQLLQRARAAGLRGRSLMSKDELVMNLRARANGRDRARFLADAGYASPNDLDALRAQIEMNRRRQTRRGSFAVDRPRPPAGTLAQRRMKVFNDYGGGVVGHIPCAGCGAKLHWDRTNPHRHEVMSLIPLGPSAAESAVLVPLCQADAEVVATWPPGRLAEDLAV